MNGKDNKHIIISDLENLAILLRTYNLAKNVNSLDAAAARCYHESTDDYYKYTVENLEFDILPMSHTIPTDADALSVTISLNIKGSYIDNVTLKNPIYELQADIVCVGSLNSFNDLISSWHLDRHEAKIENGQEDGDNKFFHPMYHLTFGGRKMWSKGMDAFGSALIFPSPRLIHMPLDATLAIDFIIRNFIPLEFHQDLVNDQQYRKAISRSQLRIWRPYFQGIIEHWNYVTPFEVCDNSNSLFYIPNLQTL